MTERIWVPKSQLVALPELFDALDAAMLEPLGVAIHAVGLAKPRMLERVGVLGCGPIGLLIVQVLKAAGAGQVLACDPLPHRRAMAEKTGADRVGDGVASLVEWSKGGCPLVLKATNSPFGFRDAVRATRIGGRIVLVGIPDGDTYTLPAADARRRGLTIKFARRMGDVYPLAIRFLAAGKVNVRSIVTHRVGLEEAPGVFAALANDVPGYGKALINLKRPEPTENPRSISATFRKFAFTSLLQRNARSDVRPPPGVQRPRTHFTAPRVKPRAMYLCTTIPPMITGAVMSVAPAMTFGQGTM
jgi:L-iditol 2-dehydrogenase